MTFDRVDSILEQWASERPDLDASPIGIFGRISRIDRLFEQSMAEFLRPHGLTLGLFDVLAALRRIGEPFQAKPSDLAATTMLTSGGMTGRLDQLEKLNLVLRVPDPDDRRVMMAQLSPEGRTLIDRLMAEHLERERDRLEWLQVGESEEFAGYLRKLEASLRSLDGRGPTVGMDY
ncbi:MarR family winged helix-turn-helix transcriptional regulator [Candidatus Poriferisocius sp.]|uniref:MarR family winged helix-turn-helix transcriptional regulator n=1 Tax=Candidatus Poriferisocius sp. TaxID=3101276 RepID=UPI003B526ECC